MTPLLVHPSGAAIPFYAPQQSHAFQPTYSVLQDGFLTMDRGRSLVLLSADDAAAYSQPLVGCWVAGNVDVRHPLVAAACLRFLCR